jgi:hypothetical protein
MLGQIPLDMIQYYMLYGVHRFPEAPKDRLTFNTNSKYIVVAHNNNFFKVSSSLKKISMKLSFRVKNVIDTFPNLSSNHTNNHTKTQSFLNLSEVVDAKKTSNLSKIQIII